MIYSVSRRSLKVFYAKPNQAKYPYTCIELFVRVYSLAIKYVVVKGKKQDVALGNMFYRWVDP